MNQEEYLNKKRVAEALLSVKRVSDVPVVAVIIGETPNYTAKLLRRYGAKKHDKAIEALERVIEARKTILGSSHK